MEATWTVPKNIRQIGEAHAHYAIYIEDYVSTYIKQVVRLSDGGIRQGALMGKVYPEGEKTIFVIEGIVTDKELYRTREQLFSERGKEALRDQCERYFAELDVIGEVIFDSGKGDIDTVRRGMFSENAAARRIFLHVDYADGTQKFYIGSQSAVEGVESYYIYYDRNEAMQNYLIAYNEETRRKVEEVHDVISGQARAAMGEVRRPQVRMQKDTLLICATCALLICVSLLGIINFNQYQKMCEMQESFNNVLASLGFGDDGSVPASSNAVRQGDADNIVMDITPEDGLAAGEEQNGLFDGLPVYVSDATKEDGDGAPGQNAGENEAANASGQGVDGNDVANASGQNTDGNNVTNASDQNAGGNDVTNAIGQNTDGNDVTNAMGQNADGNDMTNASDQGAGENDVANAMGQNADGNDTANASGQNTGGNDTANASGQDADANRDGASGQGANENEAANAGGDGTLAMGGVGENESGTYREYIIKKGDTLTAISMLFYQNKSMIQEICELNHIENADNIVAGQKILLP
ncbi:MAG: LysM peptidoglycan-binding domain-containing protein [Lachnospiraceae bacterium]|nr:LysM peptidoglycan-binding domain-containing protein [Lachnospiraceae bacterium]